MAMTANAAADVKAATKQTKKPHEGNETVLRAMQETKQSNKNNENDLYTIGEEEARTNLQRHE